VFLFHLIQCNHGSETNQQILNNEELIFQAFLIISILLLKSLKEKEFFMHTNDQKSYEMMTDYITEEEIPNVGSEENRQAVEKLLVEVKNYSPSEISLNVDINLQIGLDRYQSQIDILVRIHDQSVMIIKCVAGSLGSYERETIAGARLLESNQIPVSVVSDGQTALVRDVLSGKKIGEGLFAIPSREDAIQLLYKYTPTPIPDDRIEREKLVFRTYDSMKVNVQRKILD